MCFCERVCFVDCGCAYPINQNTTHMSGQPEPEIDIVIVHGNTATNPLGPGSPRSTSPTSSTNDVCPICQRSCGGCNVHVLPCKHRLHRTCAAKLAWHQGSGQAADGAPEELMLKCPLCRVECHAGGCINATRCRPCRPCRRPTVECDCGVFGLLILCLRIAILLAVMYLAGLAAQQLMDKRYCSREHCELPQVSAGALVAGSVVLLLCFCCGCICCAMRE